SLSGRGKYNAASQGSFNAGGDVLSCGLPRNGPPLGFRSLIVSDMGALPPTGLPALGCCLTCARAIPAGAVLPRPPRAPPLRPESEWPRSKRLPVGGY